MKLTHLDLFSGISGASYAADQVFGKENIKHIFVENDKFCQQVLKKHWPEAPIYGDIRQFSKAKLTADAGSQEPRGVSKQSWPESVEIGECYILTGGFPCQPFSQAGRRKGTEDDRHLWPEMLRVIREFRPRWVVGENVAGLLSIDGGVVFEQVCTDLEKEGYEVQPFVIPAVAVNAPHRRDRIWIVAFNTEYDGQHGTENGKSSLARSDGNATRANENEQSSRSALSRDDVADSCSEQNNEKRRTSERRRVGVGVGKKAAQQNNRKTSYDGTGGCSCHCHIKACWCPEQWDCKHCKPTTDTQSAKRERKRRTTRDWRGEFGRTNWDANWLEVATELCGVDDGLSAELDGLKLSKAGHRAARLKGLGSAWVPQVAIEIFKGIKAIES